jgi:rfaE bifunctional protein kinase chain/domain
MQENRPRLLVVGDVLLDHDRVGLAERISPEAPVPVLRFEREAFRLGGAGAVAAMAAALGAEVALAAVVGDDAAGDRVFTLLEGAGVDARLVSATAGRPTTTKERIVAVASGRQRQQVVRIDRESADPLPDELAARLGRDVRRLAGECDWDVVLVSDYAKGVCTPSLMAAVAGLGLPLLVDPPRQGSWGQYRGAACLVPNRVEAGLVEADEAWTAAPLLRRQYQLEAAVIKVDEAGAVLADAEGVRRFPARAGSICDVTGAGDQFLAVLGCVRARGGSWGEAVEWANRAAGLQCGRQGCVPITQAELRAVTVAREEPIAC